MTRLALLSDHHLSRQLRWDELLKVNAFIADDIAARVSRGEGPDLIVCAGDLTDGATRPDERNELAAFIMRLATHAPVVVVYGNHETPGDLDFLSHLRTPHPITVYASPTTVVVAGIALALLPWVHHVLPAEDVRRYSRAAAEQAEARVINAHLQRLCDGLDAVSWEAIDRGEAPPPRVFIGHAMVREAVIKPGQPTRNNRDFLLPLSSLSIVGADIYLLGHVHHAQTLATSTGELVVYNGATRPTERGEDGPHGYTLVTFDPATPPQVERAYTPIVKPIEISDRWDERRGTWGFATSIDRIRALARTGEVVFSYRVPADQRGAAKAEGERWRVVVEEDGGSLRLLPQVDVEVRARQPEIARTKSLAEKLSIWMRMRGKDPDSAEGQRIHQKLANVVASLGIRQSVGGMAQLHNMTVVGVNPFVQPITVDLDAIDGELVAVWGGNGQGKSTLLACYSALLYGVFPSPKLDGGQSLQRRMVDESASIEGEFSTPNGRVRIQHLIGRGSHFVFENGSTKPVDKSGQLAPFKRWIEENLLPRNVFHGSLFSMQGDEGIINAGPSARKALFLAATGNAALERVQVAANRFKASAERASIEHTATLSAIQAQLRSYPENADDLVFQAEAKRTKAETDLVNAELLIKELEAFEKANREYSHLVENVSLGQKQFDAIVDRRKALHDTVCKADAIRLAVEQLADAQRELATLSNDCIKMEEQRSARRVEFSAARAELFNVTQRIQSTKPRIEEANRSLAEEPSILSAIASIPSLTLTLSTAESTLATAREAERAARDCSASLATSRITVLRTGVEHVAASSEWSDAFDGATKAIDQDNALVSTAQAETIELAEVARMAAEREHRQAQENLARAKERAARMGGVEAARAALRIAEDDLRRDCETKERLDQRRATIEQEGHTIVAKIEEINISIRAINERIESVAPLASLAIDLERAEALDAELERSESAARMTLQTGRIAMANSPPLPPTPPSTFMVDSYPHPVHEAIRLLRLAISAAASAAGAANESRRKREEVEDRLATQTTITLRAETELMEWRFLVDAFGRNAIQALEIDAATPELSLYANDCLHQAFDGRFSLEVKTQGETGEGKEKEDLLIELTDAQEPTSHLAVRDVAEWSGGQKTFAWTAMASAMSLYLGARSHARIAPTIVRDETAAGVDIRSTTSYATMLRNAGRSIGGIGAKTLVVTHSRELAELADVILHLENGQLQVRNAV